MKQLAILTLILFVSISGFSQNKLKGSRNVIVETRDVMSFNRMIVSSDIDVILSQGNQVGLEVEADDNLMESVYTEVKDSILEIYLLDDVSRAKALKVHVSVNTPIFILETRDKSKISCVTAMTFDEFYLLAQERSDINLSIDAAYTDMKFYDKSNAEFIITNNELAKVNAEGNSSVKYNITSQELKVSLQESSDLQVSGNANHLELTTFEKSDFKGKDLIVETASVNASDNSNVSIYVTDKLLISAQHDSEIDIYGKATYEIILFADKAKLNKK